MFIGIENHERSSVFSVVGEGGEHLPCGGKIVLIFVFTNIRMCEYSIRHVACKNL